MTREEFSQQLVALRETDKCGKNEISRRCECTFLTIDRIETAYNSFSMKNVFKYINAVNGSLVIYKGYIPIKINDYESLVATLIGIRKDAGETLSSLAKKINVQRQALYAGELMKMSWHVDTVLNITNALNIELKVIHNAK